jgi:hypothetical protein
MLVNLTQDLRFALRQLSQRPGFTLMAVLILALGLGANTAAIFTAVDAPWLRPLLYPQPRRLVALFESKGQRKNNFTGWVR